MTWPVWFHRLDRTGEEPVDLHSCQRFFAGYGFVIDPNGPVEEPTMSRVYYLTPEGRWIYPVGEPRMELGDVVDFEEHPVHVALAMLSHGITLPPELVSRLRPRPRWDPNGPPYQLWFGETLCLEFAKRAGSQFAILDAFEAEGWPETLDLPKNEQGQPILGAGQLKNARDQLQRELRKRRAPIWIEG
jgi:hypothetical protein